ncbi:MAG: hypothetical protein JNM76_14700 [Betaproteobacteria bacterium]|nr:hypothetical protein [Betaproteobacteria bacterium]
MQQNALFVENVNEALREAVKAAGGVKVVASKLRPELSVDDASTWLRDCLNPSRRERLDPERVVFILRLAREAGSHVAMQFIGAECGYEVRAVDPEDQKERLQREFLDGVAALTVLANRLQRTGSA